MVFRSLTDPGSFLSEKPSGCLQVVPGTYTIEFHAGLLVNASSMVIPMDQMSVASDGLLRLEH